MGNDSLIFLISKKCAKISLEIMGGVSFSECGFTILLIGERNRKWVSQKIQPANFLGIYKLLGKSQRISSEFINYRKWWSNLPRKFNMVKSVEQKWKMKEILTNLGCLWGGRGPVLQPHPLRNSAGTAISAILTILGCLWGGSWGPSPPGH